MTTPTLELPLHIDSTMLSCARSCLQKFKDEFCLGLRPATLSIDLHAGACFASAIENVGRLVWQDGLPLETAKLRAFALFMDQWGDFVPLKDTPKSRERVWEAIDQYFLQWPPASDHVQPYMLDGKPSFEFTFGIPLQPADGWPEHPSGQPFVYCGRFDLLGQIGSKLCVRDEKTTTSIGNSWSEQWTLRGQFLGYLWACQQSGLTIDTVVVRGVGILKTKITLVEAIKTYPQSRIALWLEQTRRDLWRIRRAWDENYWDYNLADACTSYGGCSFRDLCASDNPERWYDSFTVRRWNPLIKNPIEEKAA